MSKEIPLTKGKVALVDDDDFAAFGEFSWSYSSAGYAVRSVYPESFRRPKTETLHRVIMSAPPGLVVDHINGDRLDNRRENMRVCTIAQNCRNSRGRANRIEPYKGISRLSSGRWKATVFCDGTGYYLGVYDTPEEAGRAYDRKATELFGEFAGLNFKGAK